MCVVKSIHFIKYKKFEENTIDFENGVNVIAGTNGTCKTSLLHVISNSYQKLDKKDIRLKDSNCLEIINQTNYMMNAKIERLNKGAKGCADPAPGVKSTLYTVSYFDESDLDFRRHDSKTANRFSMKPPYNKEGQNLPKIPVIYLGIKRLFPLGEYSDESTIRTLKKDIPDKYLDELKKEYHRYTGINMIDIRPQSLTEVKVRPDFDTGEKGIDSNTISVGEDNLYIILHSLYSLKYYYENINSVRTIESILLIDELDASLHPFLQMSLIDMFKEFSKLYKIQIVFTTHSLTAIEHAVRNNIPINYLQDNGPKISIFKNPDVESIEMFLKNKTKRNLFRPNKILVWMEDNEARDFFRILLENRSNNAFNYFDTLDINIGCDQLVSIFDDTKIHTNLIGCVCILDGDQSQKKDLKKKIISLPGERGPDGLAIEYGLELFENNRSDFWDRPEIRDEGLTYTVYRNEINDEAVEIMKDNMDREKVKKHFKANKIFYMAVLKQWVIDHDQGSNSPVDSFYSDLEIMFQKNCIPLLIPKDKWSFKE